MKPLMPSLVQKLGNAVKEVARNKSSSWWYTPHVAAASHAIADRIPLVDFVLEVRDARIPLSSKYKLLKKCSSSARRIIVLNKTDLANRSKVKEWMHYFEEQGNVAFGVNSHNKDNIKEFLNFLQARVRELINSGHSGRTITLMLVGIPNVGKSALANSLHQVGRISAAEKGKLKHATVSPQPGETKNISSLKIASHPNIYVLDTPGILPPDIPDAELCCKLALTGAIQDCLVGEIELAQYFLAILNRSDEYKKWAKLCAIEKDMVAATSDGFDLEKTQKSQHLTDHTQDFIVNNVRKTLFDAISSFNGNLDDEESLLQLIKAEFADLRKAFYLPSESEDDVHKVAAKLLNLYRTGRLGHYTLDPIPRNT
nr:DAR GTPase 2, mitochondrial [Ipomoea batatas]